jgi:uracil-DNA glycosylase
MPTAFSPDARRALANYIRFFQEMGIYDFYRREGLSPAEAGFSRPTEELLTSPLPEISEISTQPEQREEMSPRKSAVAVTTPSDENTFELLISRPETGVTDPAKALKLIREDLGDCTRCRLHQQGRKQIVWGVGDPNADLMFIGEAPGADEDIQGEPFVGRAGQLLTNMIKAMGLTREQVYIANIIKCRPPNNRTPERDECETCSPFLMRQIATIRPKVIVALGAVAARTLLAINDSMSNLRGRWYEFRPAGVRSSDPNWSSAKLAVTYHPAFLLRDPRQKKEAWKDLQMVMKELGLKAPAKTE